MSQWSRTRRRCALQWNTIQGDYGPEPEELRAEQLFQLLGQRHPLSFPETHEFSACEGCTSTPSVLETQAADCRDAASGQLARWWEPVAQLDDGLVRMPDESSYTDVEAEVGVQLLFWRVEDVQPVHWEISWGGGLKFMAHGKKAAE